MSKQNDAQSWSKNEAEIFSKVSVLGEEIIRNCADTKPKSLSKEAPRSKPKNQQKEKKNSKGVKASSNEIKVNAGNIDAEHGSKRKKEPNPFQNMIPEQEYKENKEAYEKAASESAKQKPDDTEKTSVRKETPKAQTDTGTDTSKPESYKGSPNSAQSDLNEILGLSEPSSQENRSEEAQPNNSQDPFDESLYNNGNADKQLSSNSTPEKSDERNLSEYESPDNASIEESKNKLYQTLKETQIQHDTVLDEINNNEKLNRLADSAEQKQKEEQNQANSGDVQQKPHFRKLGRKISAEEVEALKEDGERGPRATLIIHTKTVDINGDPINRRDSMSYHKSGDLFPHAHITNTATGEVYEIDKKYCSIGKSSTMECVVNERFISREHAIIVRSDDGAYYINDTNSKNGTFVNETRVFPGHPCRLRNGDRLRLADIQFVFEEYIV